MVNSFPIFPRRVVPSSPSHVKWGNSNHGALGRNTRRGEYMAKMNKKLMEEGEEEEG
jgi:hypothetical protein